MSGTAIQELLSLVEFPSRYLGTEINSIRKDPSSVDLRIALAFPDLYEIGTSHFGIQILYHILNRHPKIFAERVFAPARDMEDFLRKRGIPLCSLESATPLGRFDILGFSLLYELNYTNVLGMLDLAGIPLLSRDRQEHHPMVIAGGPCTCNPEPMADFFDAMVFGDGEKAIEELALAWLQWKGEGGGRGDLLESWSKIEGVYIPGFFEVRYDPEGFQRLSPLHANHSRVRRAIVSDLDAAPFPEKPVLPFGRPVHDRLRIELSRGCTRGCRFCQAGMLYRPVRERSPDRVLDLCRHALQSTGYEDVSLLSLSTGDYTCLVPLLEQMMSRYECDHVAVSLPSVRAGALTPELAKLIRKVRKTGFTIAPEAGSQRLRDAINKNVSESQITSAVESAFGLGWNLIKLYFMVGMPTEETEDLEELVSLVDRLRKIKGPNGRYGKINVSVATMIPKPHTPFQWAAQLDLDSSRRVIERLHEKLRMPGIQFKWQNPEMSYLEGLMARGDRRMSGMILSAFRKGCRFDGWSDQFQFGRWQEAMQEAGVDPEFIVSRQRHIDETLPWDHMDSRVEKSFLAEEWRAALNATSTADCRYGACQRCGACDFKDVKPIVHEEFKATPRHPEESRKPDAYRKVEVSFSKLGPARLFGHLEMVNIFTRALKRAGVPVKFTEGFHPKPKIAFRDALPIGMESLHEVMMLEVDADCPLPHLVREMNKQLPDGLKITGCEIGAGGKAGRIDWVSTYRVTLHDAVFNLHRLKAFESKERYVIERGREKGRLKKIDLKAMVRDIRALGARTVEMTIRSVEGANIRPAEVLLKVFELEPETVKTATVVRLGSIPRPVEPADICKKKSSSM
ncbi:MAG: TIGR03960 family B12-binding radical SAM protein [Desulfobacterales bacterium]